MQDGEIIDIAAIPLDQAKRIAVNLAQVIAYAETGDESVLTNSH